MTTAPRQRPSFKPRALLLSKRANIFYLEHARVVQKDERVMYLTQDGRDLEKFFNIPEKNTAFILLGKGTSITDAAVRRLTESSVVVGFCGSGGSPLHGVVDVAFMSSQSEYRPTQYMQRWAGIWFDEVKRLELGKRLLRERGLFTIKRWQANPLLINKGVQIPESVLQRFSTDIEVSQRTEQLLSAEGVWAKTLYGLLAKGYGFSFARNEGAGRSESIEEKANSFLDHGNYIAYGFAATALYGLGINFSFPILHGKTRRGALVFDIADLVKDAYVMPLAFASASRGDSDDDFRTALIEECQANQMLDYLFDFIQQCCEEKQ